MQSGLFGVLQDQTGKSAGQTPNMAEILTHTVTSAIVRREQIYKGHRCVRFFHSTYCTRLLCNQTYNTLLCGCTLGNESRFVCYRQTGKDACALDRITERTNYALVTFGASRESYASHRNHYEMCCSPTLRLCQRITEVLRFDFGMVRILGVILAWAERDCGFW